MNQENTELIGFTCAYTPVSLIQAAGFTPYRILPETDSQDQAGQILHDNLCPHVKRILDRCMGNDLPDIKGMVFVNSCDPMRRLADAWNAVRPEHNVILLDLPAVRNKSAISFLAKEFAKLTRTLGTWKGKQVTDDSIKESIELYNQLYKLVNQLEIKVAKLKNGSVRLQQVYNFACTKPVIQTIEYVKQVLTETDSIKTEQKGVPVFLFGNILHDIRVFELFESCGAFIVDNDLCTGSRFLNHVQINPCEDIFLNLSNSIYAKPPCARTFDPVNPCEIAENILSMAQEAGARGVICHTLKFCDPYLFRIPIVREVLQKSSIPLLLIEGDCTMGSVEQQRTRIEAFIEMLGS